MFLELVVVLGNLHGTDAGLVTCVIIIERRIYHAHVECHLSGVVRSNQHLCLFLGLTQWQTAENSSITKFSKLHQFLDKHLLVRRRRDVIKYLVHLRSVHSHVLGGAVVGDFVIERRQFRHLNEVTETLLLDDVVCHRKLEVRRFLCEDSSPSIETRDVLFLHFLRAKVFEQQIKLR